MDEAATGPAETPAPMPRALSVAGSDSGGGAGIQADLKTFAAYRVYGATAITAVTAQNTRGVVDIEVLSPAVVRAQISAVCSDLGVDAAKTGMLATAAVVEAVADALAEHGVANLVVDPVMVAKSGDRLLDPEVVDVLRRRLLPLARCLTPNLPEAEVLLGNDEVRDLAAMRDAARRLCGLGPAAVLVKGGHLEGDPVDVLCVDDEVVELRGERVRTRHTHGTGCTLSAAIAAGLARGWDLETAVRRARDYLVRALRAAPGLGSGHGPLQHLVEPDLEEG